MKKRGWSTLICLGIMVVNGLGLFIPLQVCAEEASIINEDSGQQGAMIGEYMTGMINSFDGEGMIVVSDVALRYEDSTKFYNRSGSPIAVSSLQINDYVKYLSVGGVLKEMRQVNQKDVEANQQALSLDEAVKGKKDSTTNHKTGHIVPVRNEKGIWKN